jgi:peptidyl-prolyl cis-trans isomerase B (cyclophilin B)
MSEQNSGLGPTAGVGATAPADGDKVAVIKTNHGRIVVKFFPDKAPQHAANFIKLAEDGFYDGTRFHRVIPGFMIQGGDPYTKDVAKKSLWGTGGPDHRVPAEFNEVTHERGILSAARSQDPNSAGSQFFLVTTHSPFLDRQYSVYGQVIEGMDVADTIVNQPREANDCPKADCIMKTVTVTTWPLAE